MSTQAELGVVEAHFDCDGWILYDEQERYIEAWPSDWPERLTAQELRDRGVQVVP